MVQMSYLQNRDRLMDIENKLLVTLGGRIMEEKVGGWDWHMYQFSRSVMSDPLRPHGMQHARLSCPSPTPGACSNSCPSSR